VADARKLMDDYQYGEAGRLIYDFAWGDVCDWFLEFSKLRSANTSQTIETLIWATDLMLRLLHPFMPFVTEELWQHLKRTTDEKRANLEQLGVGLPDMHWPALMLAPYPLADAAAIEAGAGTLREMAALQDVIRSIRNARAEYKVSPDRRVPVLLSAGRLAAMLEQQREAIVTLARADDGALTIAESIPAPEKALTYALGEVTAFLPLAGLIDLDQERQRLQSELAELAKVIARSEGLLNGDFAKRAPAALVEKERAKLADATAKREQIEQRLQQL
jgi:valyl-tRNA synthetase